MIITLGSLTENSFSLEPIPILGKPLCPLRQSKMTMRKRHLHTCQCHAPLPPAGPVHTWVGKDRRIAGALDFLISLGWARYYYATKWKSAQVYRKKSDTDYLCSGDFSVVRHSFSISHLTLTCTIGTWPWQVEMYSSNYFPYLLCITDESQYLQLKGLLNLTRCLLIPATHRVNLPEKSIK